MAESDYELASLLQEQFDQEIKIENPTKDLVYSPPKRPQNYGKKSLTDPSWELIDPTPNIHILFVALNEEYFWNKLAMVCVSWSKRMTSCAGICSYHGHGGFCHITLSEPLLKLRPRKDLIQTLLHEMIHAYLFVTRNNKDRDSHGPEFCKHMYRINAEAGTNITVYHSFHDEVDLYKQHWWKCNGPCQHRKPYYGMVRRAMNRAPGPSDMWWNEHKRNCNGTFVKVKEPEKQPKKSRKENSIKNDTDIRNFYPTINNSKQVVEIIDSVESSSSTTLGKSETEGRVLNVLSSTILDYSIVRNTWLHKFPQSNDTKRTTVDNLENISKKKQKVDDEHKVVCPNCSVIMPPCEINWHLDTCLNTDQYENKLDSEEEKRYNCPACYKLFTFKDMANHLDNCLREESKTEQNPLRSLLSEPF